jgi:hypothetical protein
MKMKKILLALISLILICFSLSSCKVSKDCPAYGYADEINVEQKA